MFTQVRLYYYYRFRFLNSTSIIDSYLKNVEIADNEDGIRHRVDDLHLLLDEIRLADFDGSSFRDDARLRVDDRSCTDCDVTLNLTFAADHCSGHYRDVFSRHIVVLIAKKGKSRLNRR